MITVPIAIKKGDLAKCASKKGKVNAKSYHVAGQQYGPGDIVFLGFAGAIDLADRLYCGVYRFEKNKARDLPSVPFSQLPADARGAEEVTDVV